jgi:hypothetical protein
MNILQTFAIAALLSAAGAAQAQSDWAPCADENQVCRVRGEALVRFGVPGKYAFRIVNQRIACETDDFGDPAPNVAKRCEVSYDWRRDERYRNWRRPDDTSGGWRLCANEGELCRVPGSAKVRYGANGRYAYRDVSNSVACDNRYFGDPAFDVAKQCEYEIEDRPGPNPNPPSGDRTSLVWERCATEGKRCNVSRDTVVRYGSEGRWVYREVARGVDCGNGAFGGDPLPNRAKRCETLRIGR